MNVVEPIADAVTGGIAARAVEPQTGVDGTGHTTERICLNCGAALLGDYCHQCGQHAHVHRSLGAFGHDVLHGVFHFEGKVWRTLPMLAWRPGELTRRYIEGERATFVGPVSLFLFCVFLMFAVVSWTAGTSSFGEDIRDGWISVAAKDKQNLAALQRERVTAAAAGRDLLPIDKRIADLESDIARSEELINIDSGSATASKPFGVETLNQAYRKAKQNPDLLIYKLKSNGYKFSWALIPLSLPLMWLLFPFSKRWRMYDHTVFVTYSITFVSLLVVAGSAWGALGLPSADVLMFVPPIHMYRQLRGAYSLSRLSALWRTAVLTIGAFMIVVLFGLGLVLLGALG